jgi:2'-5' RNA ligase
MPNKDEAAGRMPALPAGRRTADESWRLFIALELPANVRRSVKDHIDRLRQEVSDARASWTREENLHLTLKFVGATPVTMVEALSAAAQRAASAVSPFELSVGGCGAFPTHGQPRVLWIGINDPSGELNDYYRALEDECAKAGFQREERPLHPHLTIARLRQPRGSRRLVEIHKQAGFEPIPVNIRDVCLIRSERRNEGSRYTVISRHDFSVK